MTRRARAFEQRRAHIGPRVFVANRHRIASRAWNRGRFLQLRERIGFIVRLGLPGGPVHVVRDVHGDRAYVGLRHVRQILNDVDHRTRRDPVARIEAITQITKDSVGGPGHRRRRRFVHRGREPPLGLSAAVRIAQFFGAEHVARRMAGAAMAKSFGEICAAVPLRALRGVGLEPAGSKVERPPRAERRAEICRERQIVVGTLRPRGVARHHECIDRLDVFIRHLGEVIVRKCRIQHMPFAVDAIMHRADEFGFSPPADARVGIGRNVRRIDRAERRR